MLRRPLAAASTLALTAAVLAGCAQESTSSSASSAPSSCTKDALETVTAGKLTVGTDKPAYPPYFVDDDPSNGKGFESAVAYAVAKQLGYEAADVAWTVVPFNASYAPGKKSFDFDVNQISITPEREKAVDFSKGYYTVNQAVVALNDSSAANAKSVADLQGAKLGAQVGTTSLQFINEVIKPTQKPFVYNDTNDAKNAMQNKQIDAIVVDLPTAFYVTAAEFENAKVVGQFQPAGTGTPEQFGLLLEKGSPLTACVSEAIGKLEESGELKKITDEWLSKVTNAPFLN